MSKDRALLGLKRKDKETDLYYNRYRYYEPYSARYVSKDPIGLFGGEHFYSYVKDPLKNIDILGLSQSDSSKSNEWITQSEKDALMKPIRGTQNNIITAVSGAVVLGNHVKQTGNDAINGAQILGSNIKKGAQFVYPYLKEGAENLYSEAKTLGKKAYKNTEDAIKLTVFLCQTAGGCRRPDYMVCSGSATTLTGAITINLHNGQSYIGKGLDSSPFVRSKKHNGVDNSKESIKKWSDVLGGSGSLGFIFNKEGRASEGTNNFLDGLGGGAGVTLRNFRVGVAQPVNTDWWNLTTPKAIEIGLNTQKVGWDGGISINEKSVNISEEYNKVKEKLSK